jgi:RNA polymerase sigma-B factor
MSLTATSRHELGSRGRIAGASPAAPVKLLFRRWQRDGDTAAREQLVRRFLPLTRRLALRYVRSAEPYEDLVQVASVALLKAIDRFDPGRGSGFPAYAIPTILGEMRRHFRDNGWSLHVPRRAQERAMAVGEASKRLTNLHGRTPTVHELAAYMEISAEDVLEGFFASKAYDTVPFSTPCATGDESGEGTVGDTLGAEDERFGLVEADIALANAARLLGDRERRILYLRFSEEMTQSDIAAEVGISQMQVSRSLRGSLARLRELMELPTRSRRARG